jgi:glycosyltransferase involved in cell wall biosynthesis
MAGARQMDKTNFINKKSIAIVVPVFNEQDAIQQFHQELMDVIDSLHHNFKIYYINDGSVDDTWTLLNELSQEDPRIISIALSRNFGHQSALTAGLDIAEGDAVITMDGDGQHPPEKIPEMLQLFETGYEVVLMQRMEDRQPSLFKRWTSKLFYQTLNWISDTKIVPGAADFRLLSRKVVDSLKDMREYHRFLRGMVAWTGFRSVILPYSPPDRIAGQSKYSRKKMLGLAQDAAFSFSLTPLKIGISLGFFFLLLAFLEMVYVLSFWVTGRQDTLAPGWSSLMFIILIVGAFLMMIMGFIGIYIGYIFQEVKGRPIYIIQNIQAMQKDPSDTTNRSDLSDETH